MINIRSVLAAGLLVFGSAAIVSAQQSTQQATQQPGRHAKGARKMRANEALLKGIKLTDAERNNVKAVHAKYAAQEKALREQMKPQIQAMRDARQRGDTAAMRTLRDGSSGTRKQMMQLSKSERNDLRSALGSENQAKFDANAANVRKRFAKRGE